ncbi:MAG: putative colanic acid biosynthesis acetyltransferase [Panacagrimonas sp.]
MSPESKPYQLGPDTSPPGINTFETATFSLRNRLARAAWGLVYHGFFRWTPRPLHGLRAIILKLFGAKLGKGCHVYPSVRIWGPWNLEMADHSCLDEGVYCYSVNRVRIGKKAIVSRGAFICTGSHDFEDPHFQPYWLPITIGAHAWICVDAFIGPGVTIGEGTVIGARAVVSKSMPDWMVCAGTPCKPIKPRLIRFEDDK